MGNISFTSEKKLVIHNGAKMRRFFKGERRTALSAKVMDEFCDVCDAVMNPQVRVASRGEKASAVIGNNGIILTVPAGGSGSGTVSYRAEYENDADPPYAAFDIVRVSPANPFSSTQPGGTTVPGVYICIKDNPSPDTDFPKHPLQDGGETLFWNWLATWPSEMTVCNSVTLANEQWFIDAQPKPQITVDDTRHTVDDTDVKL